MPKHSFTLGEHRAIFVTLDELNAQRAKVGASPVVAPVTQRVANAIGTNTSNQAQIKAQQNQFARTNAQFNQTQDYFNQNPSVLADVNAQIAAQNRGLTGTTEQMRQATGTFGDTIGGTQFVTGQRNDVQDVLSQASEGATQAKLRASQNIVDLTNKFALDKSIGDQLIQDWTNTMGTAKLGGTAEAVRQPDGMMKVVAPYDPQGNFRELAAQRLREAGKTENEIKAFLESPEYTKAISETMSNTGLGGTFDQKGMFVPKTIAEAQNVLATSRNPQEKAQAQKVIDDQLNQVKGYAPRTNVDPATGATWVTYSEDAGATAKAREEAKNRMAIEEQNRLNLQKLKEDAKKKVALMVPNDIKETSDKVLQLKAVLDQLSPELRAAGSLEIQQMLDGQDRISKATQQALDTFSTDTEIEDSYQGTEDRIKQVEKLFLQFANDSRATAERVANYNRDMLMIDKKIMESKNAEDETKQIQANIKNERKLRRQLAALNITTDLQGLQYLDDAIQEGQSTLASLRNANSLNLLKAQLAIGEGYAIDMQKAMDNQRASYLDITTKTTDALEAVRKSISLDKKDRNKEIRSILAKDVEDKNKLETETAKALRELAKETLSSVDKARNESKKDLMSTKDTLGFTSNLRSGIQSNKVISQANEASSFHGVVEAGYARYTQILNDIKSGKLSPKDGEVALGPSQTAVISALSRMLDPQSVVRDAEYERQVKGVAWVNMVTGLYDKITKGGTALTATDIAEMKKVADEVNQVWQKRLSDNLQPFILDIDAWNSAYPESAIKYEQVLTNIDKVNLPSQKANSLIDSFKNAPSGKSGFRTDRHNNPTAFTTDIAKQAGLKEGVDYVNGDPFPNGKGVTAKLLGDPIDTSIKVIDNIGFYTKSGAQRWSHTAIPKSQWDNMDYNEKRNVIAKMYKNEGGSGILAKQSSKTYSFSDKKDDQIIIQ